MAYFAPPEECARLRADGDTDVRTYPSHELRTRVSGNGDAQTYLQVGVNSAVTLMQVALSQTAPVRDVLDWGCGPGRVAMHVPDYYPAIALKGCDPDAEAIAWAQENLQGEFAVSQLAPPLPYDNDSFDVVLGLSIMTHLRKDCQLEWLEELARVLRPGGVLLATVHGKAAQQAFGVAPVAELEDHYLDPFMAGILPADYYRTVLQSEGYTRSAWSASPFDVIDYVEDAIGQHDLVVCKKPE